MREIRTIYVHVMPLLLYLFSEVDYDSSKQLTCVPDCVSRRCKAFLDLKLQLHFSLFTLGLWAHYVVLSIGEWGM